jgi:hypothetical protein
MIRISPRASSFRHPRQNSVAAFSCLDGRSSGHDYHFFSLTNFGLNRMQRSLLQRDLRDAAASRSNQGMDGKKYVGFLSVP